LTRPAVPGHIRERNKLTPEFPCLASWPNRIERRFLTLAVGFSALTLMHHPLFAWIRPHISLGLGIFMFGMGLTLEFSDLVRVGRQWRTAGLGLALQYALMPAIAWTVCLARFWAREGRCDEGEPSGGKPPGLER
jgi:hypothetical protein